MLPTRVPSVRAERPPRRRGPTLAALLLTLTVPLEAQQVVSGTVQDAATQRARDGAILAVAGSRARTTSDAQGHFRLTVPGAQAIQLLVRRLGYQPVAVTVPPDTTPITIALSVAAVALDEVVITGTAGGQQARALGNAVGKLQLADQAELAPKADLSSMISGQVSSVRLMRTGGEIGAGVTTRIRGVRSLSHRQLHDTIARLADSWLSETVPGKDYSVYVMLHGVIQHNLYHAGQIALLKKA